MRIVVVIPTYNEVQNIAKILDELNSVFRKIPRHEMLALIIDSNSTDGTADVVREKALKFPWITLLTEDKKRGLGVAYFFAFRYAINRMGPDAVIEMDADFQHDPKDIVRLVSKFDNGYDYVIGSRFVAGGSIPREWSFARKFWSIGGNIFTRFILGINNVDDFTSGFKLSRVHGFLDSINFDGIRSTGFAYKLELLWRMHKLKAKIVQIPIKFGLRDRGISKMENNNAFDSLKVVIGLRFGENKEFIKFCIVGGTGFVVDAGLFNLLALFFISKSFAWAIPIFSGFVAMIVTYIFNNYWSFKDRKIEKLSKQVLSFLPYGISSMIPILVRGKLVSLSIQIFGVNPVIYNVAFLIGIILGLIWNYFVYSKIIWRKAAAKL